jgi:hypothetical protein
MASIKFRSHCERLLVLENHDRPTPLTAAVDLALSDF